MRHIKLKGYGLLQDTYQLARVVRETKTMTVVAWGNGERRFNKKTGHAVGETDRWSGWRIELEEQNESINV